MRAVPKCLESFFPDGKILPHNIPAFLSSAVKVKLVSGANYPNDIDLDVNIPLLKSIFFRRGLDLLEAKNYEEGRQMFVSFLILTPPGCKAPLGRYNLACAEALLFRSEEAIEQLERAVDEGYRNLPHLVEDSDLDSIRQHPGYVRIVKRLTEMFSGGNNNNNNESNVEEPPKQQEEQPQPQEEKEEEIKKEEEKVSEVNENVPKQETEEVKKEKEDETKYKTELQLLSDMGFVDRNKNLALLLAESGDLANVIQHLFS